MSLTDSLFSFVDKVAMKDEEVYAKVCKVEKVDSDKGTCTVIPIDGSPKIYNVRLKASITSDPTKVDINTEKKEKDDTDNNGSGDPANGEEEPLSLLPSVIEVPAIGSYVCVLFANSETAFIVLNEKVKTRYVGVIPTDEKKTEAETFSLMEDGFYGVEIQNESAGELILRVGNSFLQFKKEEENETILLEWAGEVSKKIEINDEKLLLQVGEGTHLEMTDDKVTINGVLEIGKK